MCAPPWSQVMRSSRASAIRTTSFSAWRPPRPGRLAGAAAPARGGQGLGPDRRVDPPVMVVPAMALHRIELSDRLVDLEHAVVRVGQDPLPLTQIESAALRYLGERANADVSREQMEREVWGFRAGVRSEAVPVAMRRLRRKLEADPGAPVHLLTVPATGWRLVCEGVLEAGPASSPPGVKVGGRPGLPAWLDSFVGRQREREIALQAWDRAGCSRWWVPAGWGRPASPSSSRPATRAG